MNDLYQRILNDQLFEEGGADGGAATTMDAVAYLPSQVGVVKAAMKKLKQKKSKWNLEILESDDGYLINFEDQLKISILEEDWDEFQETFGTNLDEDVHVIQFEDDIEISAEDILETRKDELISKINEIIECQEVRISEQAALKFFNSFEAVEDITEAINPVISLLHLKEWSEHYLDDSLSEHEEDLGHIEMLIENFKLTEGDCLAGARFRSVYQGIDIIFEARVTFEKDCSFSLVVNESEVADNLEEYCVGLDRIGNVFYPAVGQILSSQGVLEALKEILENEEEEEIIEDEEITEDEEIIEDEPKIPEGEENNEM